MHLENFKKLILPLKQKLFRFSLRIVGNGEEAEDVVQEVFIKMWKKREEWEQYQNIEAWCMQMTKNLSIDKLRSKHAHTSVISPQMRLVANESRPDQQTETRDLVSQISQLMENLPEKQKMVVRLRDIEELSYQEIADHLDLSLTQVKVYLHRARQSLKSQLININNYGT